MRIDDTLLRPLEATLNRQIRASTPARERCRLLDGKVLGIAVTLPPLELYFVAQADGLLVTSQRTAAPDAVLRGSSFALATLLRPDAADRLRSGAVSVEGDAAIAQDFQRLFAHARPDFEEELSRLVGDVAAHQVGNFVRGAFKFGRQSLDTLRMNTREFLQEESRDVPGADEAREFLDGVDRLAADVERTEARVQRLERRAAMQSNEGDRGAAGPDA